MYSKPAMNGIDYSGEGVNILWSISSKASVLPRFTEAKNRRYHQGRRLDVELTSLGRIRIREILGLRENPTEAHF